MEMNKIDDPEREFVSPEMEAAFDHAPPELELSLDAAGSIDLYLDALGDDIDAPKWSVSLDGLVEQAFDYCREHQGILAGRIVLDEPDVQTFKAWAKKFRELADRIETELA
jgi:hypothetical protein